MRRHEMTAAGMFSVRDVRLVELPRHAREDGEIVVAQCSTDVPFAVARMFTIRAPQGARRGEHAHRLCSQFMVCVHGAVDVVNDDARERKIFTLDRGNLALYVPPTIWTTVTFQQGGSVLAVLCDRGFEAHDYIHEYSDYLDFRNSLP
jgi:hypothetical protein